MKRSKLLCFNCSFAVNEESIFNWLDVLMQIYTQSKSSFCGESLLECPFSPRLKACISIENATIGYLSGQIASSPDLLRLTFILSENEVGVGCKSSVSVKGCFHLKLDLVGTDNKMCLEGSLCSGILLYLCLHLFVSLQALAMPARWWSCTAACIISSSWRGLSSTWATASRRSSRGRTATTRGTQVCRQRNCW